MRLSYAFAAVCLMAAPAAAETAMTKTHHVPGHEQQTYRFGATYEVSNANSASACQAQCDGASQCKSWSYLRPVRTSKAYCELKRGVGSAEANPTATSGVSIKGTAYANNASRYARPSTRTLRGGPTATTTRRYYSQPTPAPAPSVRPTTRRAPLPAANQSTPVTRAPQTTRTRTTITRPVTKTTTTKTVTKTSTVPANVKPIPQTTTVITTAPRTTQHPVQTTPAPTYYPKQQEEISRIVTGPKEYYQKEDGKPRYSVQDPKNMVEDNEASVARPSS